MNKVSFYGGETCGVPADRRIDTAKQETAGSVGYRNFQSEPELKLETLDKDTVNFKANNRLNEGENPDKKSFSALKTFFGLCATAAVIVGGLGLAHKYNVLEKITKNAKAKEYVGKATEPCYKLCASIKKSGIEGYHKTIKFCKDSYQKVADKFSKK